MEKKVKGNPIFKHYFIMYFFVLLIPMVICCSYYAYMFSVVNEDDIATRKQDLIHSSYIFDFFASEVEYLGDVITTSPDVNCFKKVENAMEYPNTYRIQELQSALPDLYLVNQAVYDYYIFFDNSQLVINKNKAYTYEQFYNLYLCKKGISSFDDWMAEREEESKHYGFLPMNTYHVYIDKTEGNFMGYTRPLASPVLGGNGYVSIFMKDDVVESVMPTLEAGSVQTIQNFSGDIIYQKAETEQQISQAELEQLLQEIETEKNTVQKKIKLQGKDCILISYKSEDSGMRYSYFVPNEIINERLMYCMLMLVIFVFIGLLVDVILSYHISMKNATPINDILNKMSVKIEKFGGHQSAFSSLKNTFNYLADSNAELADALNDQKPYLQTAFVNRLLFAGFQNEKDIVRMADYLEYPLQNRTFTVLLFRFHMVMEDEEEGGQRLLSTFAASLTELIDQKLPGSLYTDLGEGQLALIMNTEFAGHDDIKAQAKEIVSYIKTEMAPAVAEKIFVYGGSVETRPDRIRDSYLHASYLCYNEAEQIENTIIWYDEGESHSIGYPSSDMQVKLVHYVTSGDEEGLHDYLEGIVTEYFIEADLPVYLQHMLITDLQSTLFRLLGLVKLEDHEYANYYNQLEQNHNMPVLYQIRVTLNLYKDLCQSMNKQKKMQDADMVASGIVAYIDSHYGDPNLSLAMVADQFQISQPYLSSLFKQTQGINFSTYIENIRIDKAKDFLRTTDLSIVKISEMVGYGSTNSFCRAFKRVTGLNTSEYRKD
ncbi:MAG: AraC family transcriptional regulator [Lachnospiraceae bacterium]|nr:AraC family transcriptional regulator [Lachnospiraceae bacterium]